MLYLWGLSASGWANSFYSAAAQAGSASWKTTRVEVDASVETRQPVLAMLGCAKEWLRTAGGCGAWFPVERGAPRCRVCPLYDAGYAAEFWVPQRPVFWVGGEVEEVPDTLPENWTDP